MPPTDNIFSVKKNVIILFTMVILLYISSLYSYLLFHLFVEIMSIIVGVSIFIFLWLNRRTIQINFYIILGVSSLFISTIDFFHTLTYPGMNIFFGYTTNHTAQLWIAARFMQAISVLLALLLTNKKISSYLLVFIYCIITLIILGVIFLSDIFPDCFIEGTGLTLFKILCEYVIIFILSLSIIALLMNKRDFDFSEPGFISKTRLMFFRAFSLANKSFIVKVEFSIFSQ